MKAHKTHSDQYYHFSFFCLGLFPLIPFDFKPYALIPLVLTSLWCYFSKMDNNKSWTKAVPSLIIFLTFLLSATYSSDPARAMTLIWRLSPFLFIPICMVFVPKDHYNRYLKMFINVFIISSTIFCILMFAYALSLQSNDLPLIYSHIRDKFWGYEEHPIYISLYVGIALILLLSKKEKHIIYKGVFLILISALIFLARKGNIIGLVIILITAVIWQQRRIVNKKNLQYLVTIILVITGGVLLFDYNIISRFKELALLNEFSSNVQTSTGIRGILWKTGIELSFQNPFFGFGLGDVQTAINNRLIERGFESFTNIISYGQFQHLNAHNQFLQIILTAGFIGVSLFIVALGQVFKQLLKFKNKQGLFIFMYIIFCFLFESLLERQNGIMIVALFMNIYYFNKEELVN